MRLKDFEVCIIGGGVVGLACAYQLSQKYRVLLIERHSMIGSETSSRNSEVIHAGLYYEPHSLKEQLCLRGKSLLYEFCHRYHIPYKKIGKIIVSSNDQHPKLVHLFNQANRLDIPLTELTSTDLKRLEPNVVATTGLLSPTTGIIDSHAYMATLEALSVNNGATIALNTEFLGIHNDCVDGIHINLNTGDGAYTTTVDHVINCAGLSSLHLFHQNTEIMNQAGTCPNGQSVGVAESLNVDNEQLLLYPCRGHYFSYSGASPFNRLIYPLPEDNLAGLGIHATLDLAGQVRFGPDVEFLTRSGEKGDPNLDYRIPESRKSDFIRAIRQYYPNLDAEKLLPSYSGIRPKLSGPGMPAEDFKIVTQLFNHGTLINCLGIESPGLTASLAIAELVASQLAQVV